MIKSFLLPLYVVFLLLSILVKKLFCSRHIKKCSEQIIMIILISCVKIRIGNDNENLVEGGGWFCLCMHVCMHKCMHLICWSAWKIYSTKIDLKSELTNILTNCWSITSYYVTLSYLKQKNRKNDMIPTL